MKLNTCVFFIKKRKSRPFSGGKFQGELIKLMCVVGFPSHYVNLVVQLAISPLVNKQWAA